MTDDQFIGLVIGLVIVVSAIVAVAAIVASVYIVWIYRQRKEEALFLTRLVQRDVRVSAAAAVILGYLVLALSGFSFGRPWSALVISLPIWVLMIGPIGDALLWRKERRRNGK